MDVLDRYWIDLKNMRADIAEYQYVLDDAFFNAVEGTLVHNGHVNVALSVKKAIGAFELTFRIEGILQIPCDRCLDVMDQAIDTVSILRVKLGDDYADEGDLVVIPFDEGVLNVAWYMYEFIALEIPIKHVHGPGKCNEAMMSTLKQHLAEMSTENESEDSSGDMEGHVTDSEKPVDPRWNKLKKILDNN